MSEWVVIICIVPILLVTTASAPLQQNQAGDIQNSCSRQLSEAFKFSPSVCVGFPCSSLLLFSQNRTRQTPTCSPERQNESRAHVIVLLSFLRPFSEMWGWPSPPPLNSSPLLSSSHSAYLSILSLTPSRLLLSRGEQHTLGSVPLIRY